MTELDPCAAFNSLAFYLPQFHPIRENDEWWGPGFTEWTNVTKARPRFPRHYQPHRPAALGYYDLRVPDTRALQAELAARFGLTGFVYYHYWFHGRRLLERPLNEVVHSGEPTLPFCLAWANEPWSRRWDGGATDVLLDQHYSAEDAVRHIEHLRPTLMDPRYLTFQGRPIFLIYKASQIEGCAEMLATWREVARGWGLPGLYLLRVEADGSESGDPTQLGFDAAVEFQPRWAALPGRRLRDRLWFAAWRRGAVPYYAMSYERFKEVMLAQPPAPYLRWPGITPMWDNSARRVRGAFILHRSSPGLFEQWLERLARDLVAAQPAGPRLLFVNAWNEWAEGCHLEPDERWGYGYLEAHARVVAAAARWTAAS